MKLLDCLVFCFFLSSKVETMRGDNLHLSLVSFMGKQ